MPEQREWIGITLNECFFQGIVTGDPQIVDGQNGKVAFINLRTIVGELANNGQWVDTQVIVPLLVMDGRKVEVVEKYVKDKRQLYVATYYKAWKDGQGNTNHGHVVTKMKLGSKGRPTDDANVPNLPNG
jgi:hypothetical protein